MTSRELVYKTLEFKRPERIPRQMWTLPWAGENHPGEVKNIQSTFPDDIICAPVFYKEPLKTIGDQFAVGTYIDEWGCVFDNFHSGIVGEVKEPQIQTGEDFGKVRFPVERLSFDVDSINEFCRNSDKFIHTPPVNPFERIQYLRGTENVYMDLAVESAALADLLKKVHEFYMKELEIWASTEVDALMFMDDWGAQNSLLIDPNMWRDVFKPLYKDYIDLAHSTGKKVFMHSDGYIIDIIPDLIELGLDALNSQVFCMDVKTLGERFKGQITFWGEIDRQYILPSGSTEDVAKAVKEVKEALYADGGVIAQCEFGPGAKPENVYTIFETWNNTVI